jgi:hypothetical protein
VGSVIEGAEYYRFPEARARIGGAGKDYAALLEERVRPGDLIFVRTRGIVFSLGRKATRNDYDHVAVVTDSGGTLNIVNPRAVTLPVSYFARSASAPLVMRPQWRDEGRVRLFLDHVGRYGDCEYNLRKTILGTGVRVGMKKPTDSYEKWICTEAIIAGLVSAQPEFGAIQCMKLDYNRLGFATTNDFFRIARARPDLLRIVD